MIDYLVQIDESLFLFLNSLVRHPVLDSFMKLFSDRFIWVPMYATLLFIVYRNFGWKKTIFIVAGVALAITLADQICASLIRPAVCRLRPSNPENPLSALTAIVGNYRGGSYGFPSCHAANSFAAATYLSLILRTRRFTAGIFLWAVVNSLSRIYLGVHYPGDLLAGAAVGSVIALIPAIPLRIWFRDVACRHVRFIYLFFIALGLTVAFILLRSLCS